MLWCESQRLLGYGDSMKTKSKEAKANAAPAPALSFAEILWRTNWRNRTLFAVSQAVMVNNLNDGVIWGLLPILLTTAGLPVAEAVVIVVAETHRQDR